MKEQPVYMEVKTVKGLSCTFDGKFRYNGREKKVIYAKHGNRKATARLIFMNNGKRKYIQAAKAVALAWHPKYDSSCHITYRDGNIHNISADNIVPCDNDCYNKYILRNTIHKAMDMEARKRKLQLVAEEAILTKNYFETLDMEPINRHVTGYLFGCLMKYCKDTLHIGELTAADIVPDCLATMYECIMNGMCLYNYERFCKKLLLNFKKKGNFGREATLPKPIEIINHLNLDCLWEKYRKPKIK